MIFICLAHHHLKAPGTDSPGVEARGFHGILTKKKRSARAVRVGGQAGPTEDEDGRTLGDNALLVTRDFHRAAVLFVVGRALPTLAVLGKTIVQSLLLVRSTPQSLGRII